MPVPESEVRDLLAAIRDALSPPEPASHEGRGDRRELLELRAAYLTGVLGGAAESGEIGAEARFIREFTARPLHYQPEGGES